MSAQGSLIGLSAGPCSAVPDKNQTEASLRIQTVGTAGPDKPPSGPLTHALSASLRLTPTVNCHTSPENIQTFLSRVLLPNKAAEKIPLRK